MELSVYDGDGSIMDSLSPFMLSDKPIFFDFTSLKSDMWGHLMITEMSPQLRHTGWNLRVVGLLIPSWGSTFGRTKNSAILNGNTYTYFLGSNSWNLAPTLDIGSQIIQWEFTAYNPLMEVDYEIDWSNSIKEKSGDTGSYDWLYQSGTSIELGEKSYHVKRITGTYDSYIWKHSTDGSNLTLLNLTNVPFIHYSMKLGGTLEARLYDIDQTEYRYTTFTDVYPIRQFTQNLRDNDVWIFNPNGTTETDIDYDKVSIQLLMDDTESFSLDRIGLSYGRPTIYEFRVPEYDSSRLVKLECYNPSDSTWYTVIEFDPRHPDDYSPDLINMRYGNGKSMNDILNVVTFALYRSGNNGQLSSPTIYQDASVNLFPEVEYSNTLGDSFMLGLLLGPDDESRGWSTVRLRVTYPYSSLSREDYLGVV